MFENVDKMFKINYNLLKRISWGDFFMRTILHADLNNFYATCECLLHPEFEGLPLVVCGKIEDRHGVVLAKNLIAKQGGVKTGMTIFECKKIFPNVVAVEAHHDLYLEYSKKVKDIYKEYTDRVESFGIDEAWLDVTESKRLFGSGEEIAERLRKRIKEEIGLTISVGVSYNKVFAKLGSDLKKPDAVTVITRENYKSKVWPLPVEELLFVGKSTKKTLNNLGIKTIGGLARFDFNILKNKLGKPGEKLWQYANGLDYSPVKKVLEQEEIKSVGNSLTYYKDMYEDHEVERLFYFLAESVSARMKAYKINEAKTVHIVIFDKELCHYSYQTSLEYPTNCSGLIASAAMKLYKLHFRTSDGVRGVGVSVSNFVKEEQLLIGEDQTCKNKNLDLDKAVETLRGRFGKNAVNRALVFEDKRLCKVNPSQTSINNSSV